MHIRNVEIRTPHAPAPAPVFSQGIRRGALLQVSGQGPQDPETGEYLFPGDVKRQTTRVLENILAVLEAGGCRFENVIMMRVFLARQQDFGSMNEAYGQFLEAHCAGAVPCRTTLVVGLPRDDFLIEMDALAVQDTVD